MRARDTIKWNLRELLAQRGIFMTSDLQPLLAERGIDLSREQVYRLVTQTPQRLSTATLSALCRILECTPNDLLEPIEEKQQQKRAAGGGSAVDANQFRPTRAKVARPKFNK